MTANGITVIWDLVEVKARLRWTVWNSRCGQVQVLAAVRVVWSDLLIWRLEAKPTKALYRGTSLHSATQSFLVKRLP